MKYILTPQLMKEVDEYAISVLHIPSLRLMENAGKAVVKEIMGRIDPPIGPGTVGTKSNTSAQALVFCGKGNNGGDGFVVARLLGEYDVDVAIVLIEGDKKLSGDAMTNLQRVQDGKNPKVKIVRFEKYRKNKNVHVDMIIDAMLGTSFRGELKGKYLEAVEWCNKQKALKIAVDIPTGLNGETGEILSNAFRADLTVTLSNSKIGFYRGRAKDFTGDVIVAGIGIPNKAITHGNLNLVESSDVFKTFPTRASNSHKHSVGKIFILAGSKSMMGAAYLCSQSAMRSGAGQVILGIPDSEYPVIAKRTIEVMPLGLPATKDGSLAFSALDEIEKRIHWSTIVLLGCGISRNRETQQLIREVIQHCAKPLVIDADGLNALNGHREILKKRKSKNVVLTPHLGEFSGLLGVPSETILKNLTSIASDFAKEFKITLVLKGAPTIVADRNGKIMINSTGNPGMSTAGTGDVLAGIISSLMGQGNSATQAAINGVYIHGLAGDFAAKKVGIHGMIASDIIHFIPQAIREVLSQ